MENNIVVGIDIGGTHITAALVDLDAGAIIRHTLMRRYINSKGDADQIINEWTSTVVACQKLHPQASRKLGIAMPGPFDYERGICFIKGLDKYESLYNKNVKALLAQRLQVEEGDIALMNDATCFLKGELFGGAVKGHNNVVGLTLGTGLGSAVFKDGILYDGDLFCTPFKDGTTEDYISSRWFLKEYQQRTGQNVENVKELNERALHDETAASLFTEFGQNLGEIIAEYTQMHKAKTVVIGGNIINAWPLFIPVTESVLTGKAIHVSLMKAMLGEEAALLGAGSLYA